ncbi:amino acid adenylation domain-containing protein [Micromonospora sp. KC606]|uniref:non-ribosomal peptide synthetase n=1 Tax=Micromonospora sp. KC606 TaxID=2530379 RepID=UPI00104D00B5|nr:non-ribosomal peptide synthetase [Micromonospora sp. KC606]TDC85043.1 amino acid adenylation domain-containing protein [Micromonospora sp. KC606]
MTTGHGFSPIGSSRAGFAAGNSTVTLRPTRPAPPVPGFVRGRAASTVGATLTARLAGASRSDVDNLLLSALVALLSRASGTTEVSVGVADGGQARSTQPVRVVVDAAGTLEQVLRLVTSARAAAAVAPCPEARVVVVADAPTAALESLLDGQVDRDLAIALDDGASPWTLRCGFDAERYDEPAVTAFLTAVRAALTGLVRTPGLPVHDLNAAIEAPTVEVAAIQTAATDERTTELASAEPSGTPLGAVARVVADVWEQVLETPVRRGDDNFFVLGGGSLQALQALGRLRDKFAIELPADLIFGAPTVSEAARHVERAREDRSRLRVEPPQPRGDSPAPASFAQERIWFFENLRPSSALYHMPWALDIDGPVAPDILAAAVRTVVARHEALRTSFSVRDGLPVPVVHAAVPVEIGHDDLSLLPATRRRAAADQLLAERARLPFDLSQPPLLRAHLLRLTERRHILLLTLHHLVNDGYSTDLLLRELSAAYEAHASGRPPALSPVSVQYGDVAAWQRRVLRDDALADALRFWQDELAGAPAALALPTSRPRPAEPSFAGETHAFRLPERLTWELRQTGREHGTTLFVVLLAGFHALLRRYTGQTDVVVGTTSANRDRLALENVLGPVFNTLALRANLPGDPTFEELLAHMGDRVRGAHANQEVPFDLLVARLAPERDPSRSPIFQVLFELGDPPGGPAPDGLRWTPRLVDTRTAKLDLAVTLTDEGDALTGLVTHSADLFDAAFARGLVANFVCLLEAVCADPGSRLSALSVVSAVDRRAIAAVNDTAHAYPVGACLHELVERQARRVPDRVAVRCGPAQVTFAGLNARANQLAARLRAHGVGPEARVGVCLDRSIDMVVALLAVLKAGGAYVPIDPDYPDERKRLMMSAADAELLVGQRVAAGGGWHDGPAVWLDSGLAGESVVDPPGRAHAGNLAYVIFTSGSTGTPKGVLVEHGGLVNYLRWCLDTYVADRTGGGAVFSSFAFDALVPSLYAPLISGQTVHLLPPDMTPGELGEQLSAGGPYAFVKLTPSHLDLLVEQVDGDAAARLCGTLVVGADAFRAASLDRWRRLAPDTPVINEYGPTEASVANCAYPVPGPVSQALVPIGRPIANTTMYVLDEAMRPQPVSVVGELYIGGDCVVRGYAGRPALTAERFVPDPFGAKPGARLYRTGDLGRLTPDGTFEFLGRVDAQVKIDGYRIEPGEIEAALVAHPAVRQAVVVPHTGPAERRFLVAYVVGEPSAGATERELREFLGGRLPEHLVPARVVGVPAIPLNANGKLDRTALPAPSEVPAGAPPAAGPADPLQQCLIVLWAELLGHPAENIGVVDDFFTLGGRSLDVIRLISRIRETLGVRLSPVQVFREPTVAAMAKAVVRHESRPGRSDQIARAVLRLRAMSPAERRRLLPAGVREED